MSKPSEKYISLHFICRVADQCCNVHREEGYGQYIFLVKFGHCKQYYQEGDIKREALWESIHYRVNDVPILQNNDRSKLDPFIRLDQKKSNNDRTLFCVVHETLQWGEEIWTVITVWCNSCTIQIRTWEMTWRFSRYVSPRKYSNNILSIKRGSVWYIYNFLQKMCVEWIFSGGEQREPGNVWKEDPVQLYISLLRFGAVREHWFEISDDTVNFAKFEVSNVKLLKVTIDKQSIGSSPTCGS